MTNYLESLRCISCGKIHPLEPLYTCDHCSGILEALYNYDQLKQDCSNMPNISNVDRSALLPVSKEDQDPFPYFDSPLIKAKHIGQRLGLKNLYFKLEFNTLTGSFKDRPVYVGIKKAKEFGYNKVIAASSGNGASAVAAYAAREGLSAVILVPSSTPDAKVSQAFAYGAKVVKVEGPYSNSFILALQISQEGEAYNITTTFLNPYTVEGDKTVAYELIGKLGNELPSKIIVPIGAGPLLVGIYKGFYENSLITDDHIPKMVGVQSEGCNPIAKAFKEGKKIVKAEHNPNTIAGGISDGLVGYAKDGTYTLETIRKSGGAAFDVSDQAIRQAKTLLAKEEGLYVENSAAASIAALMHNTDYFRTSSSQIIVAILTGHGLKETMNNTTNKEITTIPNDIEKLKTLI